MHFRNKTLATTGQPETKGSTALSLEGRVETQENDLYTTSWGAIIS